MKNLPTKPSVSGVYVGLGRVGSGVAVDLGVLVGGTGVCVGSGVRAIVGSGAGVIVDVSVAVGINLEALRGVGTGFTVTSPDAMSKVTVLTESPDRELYRVGPRIKRTRECE